MLIEEAKGPPGAGKLLAHIRAHFGTIPKFCDEKGLDRFKVQKALNGKLARIDVDFAIQVERATDGEVVVQDWVNEPEAKTQAAGAA